MASSSVVGARYSKLAGYTKSPPSDGRAQLPRAGPTAAEDAERIPPGGTAMCARQPVNHRPLPADNACMGVRWRLKFGVRARVRRGLSGLARRSRLAWTGEEQLRLAMAAARMGTFEWDLRTNRGEMSPELEAIHGLAPGEFDGSREMMIELVHPDDREEFLAGFARATAEGGRYETEFRIVLPSGEVRWRTAVATILNDADSAPWRIVGVGQDVTDRRVAEETLAEARARYQRMVEQLPLVTYVESLDAESALYISPQIEELAGYTAEEWMADPNFFGKVLHPDDRDHVLGEFAEMHRTGDMFDGEYRVVARDGRIVWVHDVAVRVRDDAGNPLYSQGYMVEVTARHAAEQALAESRAQLEQRMRDIEHQALHDALTGLPNRTLFHDRVEQALRAARRAGGGVCVMLIDLDRFKEVNDTLGHMSGDVLLREVAQRLRTPVRESDTVARLGGDEFGVLATGIATPTDALVLAEKLREALSAPIIVGGLALEVESSIGIALAPDHGADVDTLIRHADVSMYESKKTHSPAVYCPETDHHSRVRLTLVADLPARPRAQGARRLLPAAGQRRDRRRPDDGGARAVGASRARPASARPVRAARRADGPHPPAHAVHARTPRSGSAPLARRRLRRRGRRQRHGPRPARPAVPRAGCRGDRRGRRRTRGARARDHREHDHDATPPGREPCSSS